MTALTIAVIPVALLGLEVMLNFVQALIFSSAHADVHPGCHREPHHEEGSDEEAHHA